MYTLKLDTLFCVYYMDEREVWLMWLSDLVAERK